MKETVSTLKSTVTSRTFIMRLAAGVLSINLFVIALASVSIYQSRRYYKERVEVQGQNLSQAMELTIAGILDKADVSLHAMVDEAEKQIAAGGIDEQAINAFIARYRTLVPELDGLRMTNAQGDVAYGTGVVPGSLENNADRDFFIAARDNKGPELFVTRPVIGRVAKKWVFHIARRVNKPDGSFAGVAYGAVPSDYFIKLFSTFDIGRNGSITLRDRDLAVVARYPEPQGVGSTIGNRLVTPHFRKLVKENRATATYTARAAIDNLERTFSFRKISHYPLYIIVGRATSDYLAIWRHEAIKILALVSLFVIGTLVSAWQIYRGWIGKREAQEDLYRYHEHLEELIKERTADLESANRELEAFNYSVSHDLRKPLTVIDGYCNLIQEICGQDLKAQCRDYLQEIYNGSQSMNQLIDALLEFSRLTRTEVRRETVDLSAITNVVAAGLSLAEPGRRVTFRIADGITAHGDANLLRVVMGNLLGNAWKYSGRREEAVIEFGVTDIDGVPTCFVRDNGAGFDMAYADKLFMPFQRLPGVDAGGHGIGLATVERIIKRHGGKIWAEGEPDKGAVFYFTLDHRVSDGEASDRGRYRTGSAP